ncbi:unnamed protein product [Calypogeia fissa]
MGGGSQSQSSSMEDDTWDGFESGFGRRKSDESPWPPLFSSLEVNNPTVDSSTSGELAPSVGGSGLEIHGPNLSTNGSLKRGTRLWDVESDARRDYVNPFESQDLSDGRANPSAVSETRSETPAPLRLSATAEGITGKNIQRSEKELKYSSLAPTTAVASERSSGSLRHVHKRIFKLMQIQNDSQDLSFVEKVILSPDEVFRLCNSMAAGSAKAPEGRANIDFGSLNSKSMKVVGYFGSKEIMREVFQKIKLTDQRDVWAQMQNDSLAPGLYAWLGGNSLFIFYWHQGHSLPVASRKNMSCNFIRYIFDLCDTVCVCLEGKHLTNSPLEDSPRFSKRHRTQRMQISLVKASEDSVKVTAGFLLTQLPLVRAGNELPGKGRSNKTGPSSFTFGNDYKLSEGLSRVALLVSSCRPRKLASRKANATKHVNAFSSFINEWTVDRGYRLDVKNLTDWDFVVFIRCAKLKEADDYDKLVELHTTRKEEEKNKKYRVDELVEGEKENLSRLLESFLRSFLEYKYPSWEENFMVRSSSDCHPMVLENSCATSKASQSHDSGGSDGRVTQGGSNDLFRLEDEIYALLFDKNSKQRIVFPTSAVYMCDIWSGKYSTKGEKRTRWTVTSAETNSANSSSKISPVFYGDKVTLRCIDDTSAAPRTGTVHRYKNYKVAMDEQGPLLTDEDVAFDFGSNMERVKLELFCTKGDLSEWLNQQMEFHNIWRRAVLLTAISKKLGESGHEIDLAGNMALQTLVSENPIEILKPFLPTAPLKFARGKWEELKDLSRQTSVEKFVIAEGVNDLCVDMYKTCRCDLQTRVSHFRRSPSIIFEKSLKRRGITWHGFELAPMKEDLDQLVLDSEHTFSPSCSATKEIIDLDPSSQTLLRVVFLKAGQLLVFVIDGHSDPKDLVIYLCPKLGVKLTAANCIRTMKRGFDLVAFDERSRYIAFYDCSISIIKTFRFDETFRHMDWTGVDIALSEYSIGRLIWMDFVTGKTEIVFIDDHHRVRLCEVSQPGMVRSGNVHVGHTPIVKACVTTQGSCLLLLRNTKSVQQVAEASVKRQQMDDEAEFGLEPAEGLDNDFTGLNLMHASNDGRADGTSMHDAIGTSEEQCLTIDVYKLDDSVQHFSSIPLGMNVKDPSKLVVGLVSFSSQMHLVVFDSESPSTLTSKVIKISSASKVCQLQQVTWPEGEAAEREKNAGATQAGPVLDYIYQIYEKYATSPPLSQHSRDLHLGMVLKGQSETHSSTSLREKCIAFVKTSLERLKRDKGKDFSALNINFSVHDAEKFHGFEDWASLNIDQRSRSEPSVGLEVSMGVWMTRLICLVPIQIARAEHNALIPLVDGLQLSGNVHYADAISLANAIRFGLYEAIYHGWAGPVKVISSMGKQSSGKSYLLNHLSGSLLDVAGGRCTDGVWMTLRPGEGCLYVLLDFEGLGSFERSEQEDMLLSMLNAAVSNLTIFNKKDFHLDKETEAIFERFQNGVSLVKTDDKLFRGLFYMAIKDVDTSDVEELKKEFFSKISQICSKSQDNFLTRMYGGAVEISAMPSFNRPEFHESIADIAGTIEELEASYLSGRSFLLDLKLIIAQITTKDWSPIDSKRVALRINLLRKHLRSAISVGSFFSDGILKPLIQFDDCLDISDELLVVHDIDFPISDTALELTAFQEKKVTGDILLSLMATFKTIVSRKGEKDEEWHSFFEDFISALVLRRKTRVQQWIASNTADFPNDGDIQKLQFETVALLAEVQQNLLLCSCKCERCFLRCVQEKGHPSNHSCTGDHRCVALCTYCLGEESVLGVGPCNDVAGHDGPHDCKEKSHTCGKCCTHAATSSNCNGNCSKKIGHTGEHQCNSKQHICNQVCSLPYCKNPCVSPIDVGDHEIHACHEKFCPIRCTMKGCNRTCATEDHFHGVKPGVTHHFCGAEHPCSARCEHKGNCEVLTEVSKKTQTFTGQRATFDYVLVSEQNGNRKGCCIVIPPHKENHNGPHSHSSNPDAVHFCETRCHQCGYFCTRPIEHSGLHSTTHGNMRDVNFVSESEEIDIQDRKYAWGESGVAEMCQMHCKAQGRGHIHLIHCPANRTGGTCRKLFDGSQHEIRQYGPDFDVPKDEMTHAAFWDYMRFEDPCSAEEQKQFALCNHQCKSDEHTPASGGAASSVAQNISYCTESLWHQPVPKTDLTKFGTGYITDDGHHFSCDHSTNVAVNVIFIIDRSSSMSWEDIRPGMTKFLSQHANRLGCVYEAILRFIRTRLSSVQEDIASVILFNHTANTVISLQAMEESLVDNLLGHYADGSTTYSSGLQHAEHILSLATTDARLSRKSPVIIFLSDGGNNGGSDPLSHIAVMKALDPKLQLHTIMFGKDPNRKILEDMAKAGDGTFEVSLDEVQLSRRFEGLAKSLRPKVASLL